MLRLAPLRNAVRSFTTLHKTVFHARKARVPAPKKEPFSAGGPGSAAAEEEGFTTKGAIAFGAYIVCLWVLNEHCIYFTQTEGPSMMPTLNEMGDVVLVDMLSLKWKPLHRNDVIVAEIRGSDKICKRIVGLPGDTIHVHGAWFAQKVPEGHLWIEGDNLDNSNDSRAFGPLPLSSVRGRVVARVWPPTEACWIDRENGKPTYNALHFDAVTGSPGLKQAVASMLHEKRLVRQQRHKEEAELLALMKAGRMAQYLTSLEMLEKEEEEWQEQRRKERREDQVAEAAAAVHLQQHAAEQRESMQLLVEAEAVAAAEAASAVAAELACPASAAALAESATEAAAAAAASAVPVVDVHKVLLPAHHHSLPAAHSSSLTLGAALLHEVQEEAGKAAPLAAAAVTAAAAAATTAATTVLGVGIPSSTTSTSAAVVASGVGLRPAATEAEQVTVQLQLATVAKGETGTAAAAAVAAPGAASAVPSLAVPLPLPPSALPSMSAAAAGHDSRAQLR